jgi:hypothetical protein
MPEVRNGDEAKKEEKVARQSDRPCEKCGSWYHSGGVCKCGNVISVKRSFYIDKF